jgi:hypothetical protein
MREIIAKENKLPQNSVKIPNPSDPRKHHTIKRKFVTAASKTLGVFKAATLSQTEELKYLKEKAHRFAKARVSCPLSHMHAWLSYWTVCIPGLTYSSLTTLLRKETMQSTRENNQTLSRQETWTTKYFFQSNALWQQILWRDRFTTIIRRTRHEPNTQPNATHKSKNISWEPNFNCN